MKPQSAMTSSPADIRSKKPLFAVMYLSDTLPPHNSDTNENAPVGVINQTFESVMSFVVAVCLTLGFWCSWLLNEYFSTVYDNSGIGKCQFERPWHMFFDFLK
jgi:hypothetical protein